MKYTTSITLFCSLLACVASIPTRLESRALEDVKYVDPLDVDTLKTYILTLVGNPTEALDSLHKKPMTSTIKIADDGAIDIGSDNGLRWQFPNMFAKVKYADDEVRGQGVGAVRCMSGDMTFLGWTQNEEDGPREWSTDVPFGHPLERLAVAFNAFDGSIFITIDGVVIGAGGKEDPTRTAKWKLIETTPKKM